MYPDSPWCDSDRWTPSSGNCGAARSLRSARSSAALCHDRARPCQRPQRHLALELARSDRTATPFTIAFLDIDGFKRINDEYGHVRGDAVLRAVGNALMRSARATDFVGRYGGDEFLVVMPGTDAEPAAAACARLVAGVAAVAGPAHEPGLQLSVGTATWGPDSTATELIEAADRAMFLTKRSHDTQATAGEQG